MSKHLAQSTQAEAETFDRNRIVERYAYLINKVAYKMIARLPANVEMDDLRSAGVIGLIDAAEKYDPEKSSNFKSYAEIRIRGAMVDELRSLDWVPRSVRQKSANIEGVRRAMTARLGRPASHTEVADEMGLTLEEFQLMQRKAQALSVISYEDLGGGGEERRSFLDCIADSKAADPEQSSQESNERQLMLKAIQKLTERQRVVLSLYYFEDLNLKEIGGILGVTESRISQIHSKAVSLLRPILAEMLEA
ncbi:FliA/WhiG family RNA polymerase sigma factor [Myxococcota bacterium]|nr:FliA/WhiG family RNA polymerase sigma factor [Myxococcota bacterium]MBU1433033.1 FliA/WhiG family RNA polymerase sigma factor [Myxococcota bacterium]MBU1899932.1 FliA/WhiG family RNA polymerase sigma factor [Myxococcota bacterium]